MQPENPDLAEYACTEAADYFSLPGYAERRLFRHALSLHLIVK